MDDGATVQAAEPARRRLRLGKSMMPLLAGLAAALLALALVIAQTIVAQREARERATSERSVLLLLGDLLQIMADAESSQRGFLLTGKRAYLTPYFEGRQRRRLVVAELRRIVADPTDRTDVERLRELTDGKFDELDRTVQLASAGLKDQAVAIVDGDLGKAQMDLIRREVARQGGERERRRREAFERAAELERRLLPLIGGLGLAILLLVYAGFRAERSRALAQARADQADALREANERTELLARELNHRVKNLFSVILSIVTLSGRKQAASREVIDDIRARIRALSLAHSASQGGYGTSRSELGPVIASTMEPYADDDGERVRVNGPQVDLPARMITPLGLIVHELATNAVKYGALSVEGGTVDIGWTVERSAGIAPSVTLRWVEAGGPPVVPQAATAEGFGTRMTTLAAGQLGGAIAREWPASGAVVTLTFPLA